MVARSRWRRRTQWGRTADAVSSAPATRCCSQGPVPRHERVLVHRGGNGRRGAARPGVVRARCRGDARVHAGRDLCLGEGDDPGGARRTRHADHRRQHLSPDAEAGGRSGRGPRRPALLHALGAAHPHRLGRLPGVQSRCAADHHRGGGRVPLPHRRLEGLPRPGALDGGAAIARVRRGDGVRRLHRVSPGRGAHP